MMKLLCNMHVTLQIFFFCHITIAFLIPVMATTLIKTNNYIKLKHEDFQGLEP